MLQAGFKPRTVGPPVLLNYTAKTACNVMIDIYMSHPSKCLADPSCLDYQGSTVVLK